MNCNTANFHDLVCQPAIANLLFRRSIYFKVFIGMLLFCLILKKESFGGDPVSYIQCALIRKSEHLDSTAALPKMVRFSNHENAASVVPETISSNCLEFYRPDGTLVLPRERLLSVNFVPPDATDFRVISKRQKSIDIQIDDDCQVTRNKQGVIVQSMLYEWQLKSGDYIMLVRWDSPSTVYLDGRLRRSKSAFGEAAHLVNILSTPILVHVR